MPWVLLRRVVPFDAYSELVTAAEVIIPPPQLKGKRAPPASVSIWWAVGSFVALPSFYWIGNELVEPAPPPWLGGEPARGHVRKHTASPAG